MELQVKKRNGKIEEFDANKINKILTWACEGIKDVSVSDIALTSNISIYNKIKTSDIHEVMIQSAYNLISEENPNYQWVASRLRNFALRKEVWGNEEPPKLWDHLQKNKKIYDSSIWEYYSESDVHKIGKLIKHDRDFDFTHAGIQQMIEKYLVQNRNTGKIYETPQFAYILVPMILFREHEDRYEKIKQAYNFISQFKINLPTPILAGVRTKSKYYSSCVLVNCDDTLDSIFFGTSGVIAKYTAKRSGIGINAGRIRSIGSPIRDSEVLSTGIVPFLKVFEGSVKSTSQNGLRGGGATVSFPWWHFESQDICVLKNNSGTDDNRVRKLDYCIQLEKVFYDRLINDEDVTLFCPHEAKGLYDSFGTPDFERVYKECEANKKLRLTKTIKARELAKTIAQERLETGRLYIMNIDHCNTGPWKEKVEMTNLCVEILQPTRPLQQPYDDDGEIGVCVLSAVNLLETKPEELSDVCKTIVELLDELISYQDYPFPAAENFCKQRRSLGVGVTNFAAYLASMGLNHESPESIEVMNDIAEQLQYHLLWASTELAEKYGACEYFDRTMYSDEGWLPIHRYKEEDRPQLKMDWEALRKRIDQFGLRNSTTTAQMPCESSSIVQCSTNSIEAIRSFMTVKTSNTSPKKVLTPRYPKWKDTYSKVFELPNNENNLRIIAAMQKWFDMSISTNTNLNYNHYEGKRIPLQVVIKDIIMAYKLGIRTLYYNNTPKDNTEKNIEDFETGCEGGACSI